MSVIAGLCQFEESVDSQHELLAFRRAIGNRYRANAHFEVLPNIAIGCVARTAILPSEMKSLNLRGISLSWDGRLDNRNELITEGLQASGDVSDAELVLESYRRWGRDFISRLLGEFAFALWDSQAKLLILGRDVFGIRPVFYHVNAKGVRWASDLQTLLHFTATSTTVDDEFVSTYLLDEPSPRSSPFREIRSLPAAHLLVSDRGKLSEFEYWRIDARKEIRYSCDKEYEEHFTSLFRESVLQRLQANGKVTIEVSGGLDSSSIACMADHLVRSGACSAQAFQTVSFIHDESSTSDESSYIVAVETKIGRRGHHVYESTCRAFTDACIDDLHCGPAPERIFGDHWLNVQRFMHENDSGVLISGHGGDHVLVGDWRAPFDLADCVKSGRVSAFARKAKGWGQTWPLGSLVWRGGIWPCLPRVLRRKGFWGRLPEWLNPALISKWNLKDRILGPREVDFYGFARPSSREVHASFRSLVHGLSAGYSECFYSTLAITRTFPYLHRPLVEFMAAIPIEQNLNFRTNKSLLRRSMKGILPELVRLRTGKNLPTEALLRALRREWHRLSIFFEKPLVCEFGYADPTSLRREITRARHGLSHDLASLVRLFTVEQWLRSLADSRWVRRQFPYTAEPHPLTGNVFSQKAVTMAHRRSNRKEVSWNA